MPFYAVANGRNKGIFDNWQECKEQTIGFKKPIFRKFLTLKEAEKFMEEHGANITKNNASNQNLMNSFRDFKNFQCSKPNFSLLKENEGFFHNQNGDVVAYTDGACGSNGRKNAKAGIGVFWGNNNPNNVSRPLNGLPTNNRAEIEAARVAIEIAFGQGFRHIEIRTDSQFMIDSITKWILKWRKNDWKLLTGEPVKNKDDWLRLDEAIKKMEKVVWTKVEGHSGDYGNDQADRLARQGINKTSTKTIFF